jgi:chromosome partitioning protein
MKIIALVSNKGGAGKTTLTVNFATGLERHGRVAILDADPQRSSLQWRSMSARNDAPSVFDAVAGLTFKARQQANQYDYLLIDCPPSVEAQQTQEALRLTDLALIPV